MRFYAKQHRFYCGIDLHARLLAVCVLDQADVAIAGECMFAGYWVADLCRLHQLPFSHHRAIRLSTTPPFNPGIPEQRLPSWEWLPPQAQGRQIRLTDVSPVFLVN